MSSLHDEIHTETGHSPTAMELSSSTNPTPDSVYTLISQMLQVPGHSAIVKHTGTTVYNHDVQEKLKDLTQENQRLRKEHKAMSKGAQTNARVVNLQAAQIHALREAARRLLEDTNAEELHYITGIHKDKIQECLDVLLGN